MCFISVNLNINVIGDKIMMNLKVKKDWINALRSGDYAQGEGTLRNSDNEYCCLGVLLDVVNALPSDYGVGNYYSEHVYFEGEELSDLGRENLGINDEIHNKLIKMNDRDFSSFKEIADYIENNEDL